jgi:NAD(P)-dependent dehydrogenase (short-subunit alcohol dehydrogenase family)
MLVPRSILITGCSSGIGYYCAKSLHERGYRVIASCRDEKDTLRLREEGLECITLDLNDDASIEQGVATALSLCGGRLDALFNNGAYGQTGALEDLPTQALRAQFETNLFGWHHLTRLIIPQMLKQDYGRIIQNSSVLGLVAMKYRGAYNASKFALEGYTDTLRLELEQTPIKISLIEPGPIHSQFRHNAKRQFLRNIDWSNSRHSAGYQQTLKRLARPSAPGRFTLDPDAVFRPLCHALEAKRPRARYRVTTPSKIMSIARRILPTVALDKLVKSGGS